MNLKSVSRVLEKALKEYQAENHVSFRKIAKKSGVSNSFVENVANFQPLNPRNCFALQKLAKFFRGRGFLLEDYQDIFVRQKK